MKIIKNIPNMLTASRIVSCILGALFFVTGNIPVSVGLYLYGAVSDAFDGFLARKLNATTELGKKLDPVSDKIYALSLIMPSIILGNYFMILTLFLEAIISGINIYSNHKHNKVYTEKIGKIKTIMLFPTMITGLFSTVYPKLLLLFLPSFFISTKLQIESVKTYCKQLSNYNNTNNNLIEKDTEFEEEDKEVDNVLDKEIVINYNKNNSSNKCKRLIRKKDNNDRY